MKHKIFRTQRQSALNLSAKRGHRFSPDLMRLTAQVDQITRVNHEWRAVISLSQLLQLARMIGIDAAGSPHARAGRKYLESVCADFMGAFGGFKDAARGRKVKPNAGSVHLDS